MFRYTNSLPSTLSSLVPTRLRTFSMNANGDCLATATSSSASLSVSIAAEALVTAGNRVSQEAEILNPFKSTAALSRKNLTDTNGNPR